MSPAQNSKFSTCSTLGRIVLYTACLCLLVGYAFFAPSPSKIQQDSVLISTNDSWTLRRLFFNEDNNNSNAPIPVTSPSISDVLTRTTVDLRILGLTKSFRASSVHRQLPHHPPVRWKMDKTLRRLLQKERNNIFPPTADSRYKNRLPKAIIIGVKKGGTRALLEYLRLHPDVRAAGPEPHFFDKFYHLGLDWYRNQMPKSLEDQIAIEKTPSYFITEEAPQRVHNMSSTVKLLVVVRNPVTRAISDYTQTASKRAPSGLFISNKTFEDLAFLNHSGLVDTTRTLIRIGIYYRHLERWLKYFPRNSFHFVSGEKLISDPVSVMREVQDFLGLRQFVGERHFYFNATKGFPCVRKGDGTGPPHCFDDTKGRTHPYIHPQVVKRLEDFYRPFNLKFCHMVGQHFGWP